MTFHIPCFSSLFSLLQTIFLGFTSSPLSVQFSHVPLFRVQFSHPLFRYRANPSSRRVCGGWGCVPFFGTVWCTSFPFLGTERTSSMNVWCVVCRVVEGLLRSAHWLQERLHQSYFFYLQPRIDRFISIAYYYPPLGCLLLAALLRAFAAYVLLVVPPRTPRAPGSHVYSLFFTTCLPT